MSEVENLTRDPVCDMVIEKTETKYTSEFDGETYYFCTRECKDEFEATPRSFVPRKHVA